MRIFHLGDEVRIYNNSHNIYQVIGYKIESYNYKGKMMEHNTYCLHCVNNNIPDVWVSEENLLRNKPNRISKDDLNRMLDDFNNYMALYELFQDEVYKEIATELIDTLKQSTITS